MPSYYCKVISREGKKRDFVRESVSEEILIRELNRESIFPVEVREIAETSHLYSRKGGRAKKFSRSSVVEFIAAMSQLLSSGLTFKDALEIAQTIYLKGEVNTIVITFLDRARKGGSLHETVEEFGHGFPPIFRGLVRIGEKIGSLAGSFKRLLGYMTEEKRIRERLINSLLYPAIVLSVAFIGIIGIVFFVLPKVEGMFGQIDTSLPPRLQSMTGLLNAAVLAGIGLTAFFALLVVALSLLRRSDRTFFEKLDRGLLKLPLVGRFTYLREMLNLLFAMETLTSGGFVVEVALLEAGEVVGNRAIRSAVLDARQRIIRGENLSDAFLENRMFSKRIGRWIAIGEQSGRIEDVFGQLRLYYQAELEKWSARFMTLIEPFLILTAGIVIFLIIIFVVVPIFSIYEGLL
jgi:type II secretory pathway component PulF